MEKDPKAVPNAKQRVAIAIATRRSSDNEGLLSETGLRYILQETMDLVCHNDAGPLHKGSFRDRKARMGAFENGERESHDRQGP